MDEEQVSWIFLYISGMGLFGVLGIMLAVAYAALDDKNKK